ncbi:glycosyltransferase [Aeromonas intestinalis]
MTVHSGKVLSIVVTYEPNWGSVIENITDISSEIDVFISDNSKEPYSIDGGFSNGVFYHHNGGNIGIAAAQNTAIRFAKEHDYEYVIFIDDDSSISLVQINDLLSSYDFLERNGYKVAALCAVPNQTGGLDVKKSIPKLERYLSSENLMSSSSITAVRTFNDIGMFDESLFIDYVDYEWGWRARNMGYDIIIDSSVVFSHHLGEGVLDLKVFRLGVPSPVRHYFQTRNMLKMMTLNYVPLRWKISQLCLFPIRFIIFSFFYSENKKRRKFFLKGIKDFFS